MSKSVNIGQPLFNNIEGHPFILGPQGPYSTKEEARRALISFYENIDDIPNGQECIIAGVRFVWRDNDLYENLAVKVINENNTDLNSYSTPGTYRFSSIRNNNFANLPINNNNPNASITGELVVYNSIEGTTTYRSIIGQVLFLSNAEGHETKIYTRSANKTSKDGGITYDVTWGDWQVCQGMKEVGVVNSYDYFIDNGMYSGVYNNNGIIETFIVITINDYVVKSQLGASKSVSQLKYALNAFNNESKLSIRVGGGQEFKWGEWKLYFDEENITYQITNLQNQLNSLTDTKADKIEVEKKLTKLKEETKEEINSIKPIVINGNVINAPDDEDLTTDDNNRLKFKDRNSSDGMGYIILRKNFIEGKNTLTQDMVNQENTIYEIRYDFDLNGEEVTIPESCVLEFHGGSFSNGTIKGNNTLLNSTKNKIFDDILILGDWNIKNIYSEWFDLKEDINYDNLPILRNIFALTNNNVTSNVYIENGTFYTSAWTIDNNGNQNDKYGVIVPSNTHIYNNATIRVFDNNFDKTILFYFQESINCTFSGGRLIGNLRNHEEISHGDHTYGIGLEGAQNIIISNIIIEEFWSDGINLQSSYKDYENHTDDYSCKNVTINNVKCLNNGRQGLSIEGCVGLLVTNSEFSGTGSIKYVPNGPWKGIDIEPWYSWQPVSDLHFSNCILKNNKGGAFEIFPSGSEKYPSNVTINNIIGDAISLLSSNVTINNSIFDKANSLNQDSGHLSFKDKKSVSNIKVRNCTFTGEFYGDAELSDCLFENCSVTINDGASWSGYTIYILKANNVVFKNNTIKDARNKSFGLHNRVKGLLFDSNTISIDNTEYALFTGDYINNIFNYKNCNRSLTFVSGEERVIFENNILNAEYAWINYLITLECERLSNDEEYDFVFKNNKIKGSYSEHFIECKNSTTRVYFEENDFSAFNVDKITRDTDIYPFIVTSVRDNSKDARYHSYVFNRNRNLSGTQCACIKIPKTRFSAKLDLFRSASVGLELNSVTREIEYGGTGDTLILSPMHINTRSIDDSNSWQMSNYPVIASKIDDYVYLYIKDVGSTSVNFTIKIDILTEEYNPTFSIEYYTITTPNDVIWDSKVDILYTITDDIQYIEKYKGLIKVNTTKGTIRVHDGLGFNEYDGEYENIKRYGEGTRPIPRKTGFVYFDTDLNKPIWWTGENWVDATGANV